MHPAKTQMSLGICSSNIWHLVFQISILKTLNLKRNLAAMYEKWFQVEPSAHISPFGFVGWLYFEALVGCHDILILGKSPIKWRQRPDMTLAVDWDVKHQLKKTNLNEHYFLFLLQYNSDILPALA